MTPPPRLPENKCWRARGWGSVASGLGAVNEYRTVLKAGATGGEVQALWSGTGTTSARTWIAFGFAGCSGYSPQPAAVALAMPTTRPLNMTDIQYWLATKVARPSPMPVR